jgi:K+-sensing histidine kinase KdpD
MKERGRSNAAPFHEQLTFMPLSYAVAYKSEGRPNAYPGIGVHPMGGATNVARETAWWSYTGNLPLGFSLAGVAACTWLSFHFGQGFAFTGFLYLVLVVLAALYGGFWQATVVSVAAAACLNYFFVPPIFSFVNSPANWVALGAFEFTALVISRLSLRAQLRATEAIAGRRDMERLYETSRRILLLDSSGEAGGLITSLIREIFELTSVQLYDALSGMTYGSGPSLHGTEQKTRDAYLLNEDAYEHATRTWFCVLRLGARPVGGLALHDTGMTRLAATALASLSGIALERVRALQRESHAEAARQTEQLRTAVLDALAHQFKTPLDYCADSQFRTSRPRWLDGVADRTGNGLSTSKRASSIKSGVASVCERANAGQ